METYRTVRVPCPTCGIVNVVVQGLRFGFKVPHWETLMQERICPHHSPDMVADPTPEQCTISSITGVV